MFAQQLDYLTESHNWIEWLQLGMALATMLVKEDEDKFRALAAATIMLCTWHLLQMMCRLPYAWADFILMWGLVRWMHVYVAISFLLLFHFHDRLST